MDEQIARMVHVIKEDLCPDGISTEGCCKCQMDCDTCYKQALLALIAEDRAEAVKERWTQAVIGGRA